MSANATGLKSNHQDYLTARAAQLALVTSKAATAGFAVAFSSPLRDRMFDDCFVLPRLGENFADLGNPPVTKTYHRHMPRKGLGNSR